MLLGWFIALTVTRRLERLALVAGEVASTGRLDVDVPVDGRDETGRLGRAFSGMLDALHRSKREQQQLVQDAGHELRTPLTSLRTNVSVLRRRFDNLPADAREQLLNDLDSETRELTDLVNELVELATESRDAALAALVREAHDVPVDFAEFFVPDSRVTAIQPPDWIKTNDQINVALQRHFALGCAQAGLDVLAASAAKKANAVALEAHRTLSEELEACRKATAESPEGEAATAERLQMRAWAIEMAFRCAQAAVAATGGSANSSAHPAQRIYREALVYAVSAQTTPIMEATLTRLAGLGV